MTIDTPALALLAKAANLLEKHGRTTYNLLDRRGSMCAMGALNMAYHGSATYPEGAKHHDDAVNTTYLRAIKILAASINDSSYDYSRSQVKYAWRIANWNNDPKTKTSDVLHLMRNPKVSAVPFSMGGEQA